LSSKVLLGSVFFLVCFFCDGYAQTTSTDNTYLRRVHQGDLIDIHVLGHLDFDWRGRINPEGFLDGFDKIPNQIYALCRTETEIAAELEKILSTQLREPRAEVKIVDTSQRPFAVVDGAVATPTRFQIRREVRLIELITAAGGFNDRSNGKIGIVRPIGLSCIDHTLNEADLPNAGKPIEVAISDLLSGDPKANVNVVSGDMVVVAEALPLYMVGAVATQGRIDHRPQLSVSRAIDASGGVLKDAEIKQVAIFRRFGGVSELIHVDLEKIRGKESQDVELKPFDIVDVPYKGRPPRKFPPVGETESNRSTDRTKLPLKIIE